MNKSRPRVLWDMTFAARSLTGTRVYAENLSAAIVELGSYEILAVNANTAPGTAGTVSAGRGLKNLRWLAAGLAQRGVQENADLIHAAAYLGPRRAPCPVVVNVLDTTFLEYPREFDWKWRLYARFVIPSTVRRAAAILTLSEHARGEISGAYDISSAKLCVVYPGVGSEFYPIADGGTIAGVRTRYQLEENYLLFVGAQERRKNIPALVGAFAQLRGEFPELQLALVGPRGGDSSAILRSISELGLASAVRDLGYVDETDLPALYAGARVFLYASRLEGFGMPPLEAMACGTPVVAAPNPPLREVLGDAALFVENDSPQAIGAGVIQFLTDDKRAAKFRERGLAHAAQFTWQRAARTTVSVYDTVRGGHSRG